MKIAIVMITYDRGPSGRKNYFSSTMESLWESRLWASTTPFEFHIFDSGSESIDFIKPWDFARQVTVHDSQWRIAPKHNAGRALLVGSEVPDVDWVLFLEDDIKVCRDFLDGVATFLETQATDPKYKAVTFYTPYREVEAARRDNRLSWEYPVKAFYGTQCMAFRKDDAASCGRYLLLDIRHDRFTPAYDMIMKDWFFRTHPSLDYFLASVPCYVQHTGEDSILNPGRFHQCGGFAGEDWSALTP